MKDDPQKDVSRIPSMSIDDTKHREFYSSSSSGKSPQECSDVFIDKKSELKAIYDQIKRWLKEHHDE